MNDTNRKIHEHTELLRDKASEIADRVDVVAEEVSAASARLGKHVRRVGRALDELAADAERPATGVARALDDLHYEAKRSFDRITGKSPRPWYERLMFWR